MGIMTGKEYIKLQQVKSGLTAMDSWLRENASVLDELRNNRARLFNINEYLDNRDTSLINMMEETCRKLQQDLIHISGHRFDDPMLFPEIGILPLNDFNASARLIDGGYRVCIIDHILLLNLHRFSLGLIHCVIAIGQQPGDHVRGARTILQTCREIVSGEFISVDRICLIDFIDDTLRLNIGSYLYQAMQVFIVAHEVAHHILGHCDSNNITLLHEGDTDTRVSMFNISQLQEFEADAMATNLLFEYFRQQMSFAQSAPSLFVAAPLVLTGYFEVIDYFRFRYIDSGLVQSQTHPTARDRCSRLEELVLPRVSLDVKHFWSITKSFFNSLTLPNNGLNDESQ